MAHEHPLAYLIGIEGLALLRAYAGDHDATFTAARINEIRKLLDDPTLTPVDVDRIPTVDGYRLWSDTYDTQDNPALTHDGPLVNAVAGSVPPGTAVDAACGTGRLSTILASHGHHVIGVDNSPHMLRHTTHPGDVRLGTLEDMPVETATADIVTCGLALSHLPTLDQAFAEFGRVLKDGGHLVISDIHPESVRRSYLPTVRNNGHPARITAHHHLIGDYLRAALKAHLTPLSLEEPRADLPTPTPAPTTSTGDWDTWPWSLAAMIPEATRAANHGEPIMLLWHFRKTTQPPT